MKKILEFHGNGSVVEVEGIKRQAGEAPSAKPQAPSHKLQAREACDKLSRVNLSFPIYPAPTPATCQVYHIL